MNYHRFVLKNGLRVILVPIAEVGSVTTMTLVGAGSRYEKKTNNGISHFLEHMAFKGTAKRPTAREIATLIDGIGAESNAFTGKELTGYYIKSSSNHVDLSLDILSDMLIAPKLDSAEIDKERGVILEEINLYEDTPMRRIVDLFERLLYKGSSMGWDIAGEKEVIRGMKREDFLSYMKELYSADNIILVVAGKIDIDKVKVTIDHFFSSLPTFPTKGFKRVTEVQKKARVFLKHKNTEQAHFACGIRTVGLTQERDRYPLSVLAAILGGGMSSRLFHEVREKRGLAYYVRTISEHYQDVGYLASYAGVDPKRVDDAVQIVVSEYQKIRHKGDITDKELSKAKEFVKGHFILELEDTQSVASFFGGAELLERKTETPQEVIEKIKKVTLPQVLRVAQTYITPQSLNLALIGDFKDKERFQRLLG